MATVFETRLIGNIGKDASVKEMERGVIAINFPVAHNKNWRDKRTGETKTKTTWVNCTIWKREGANMRILDYLKKGTLIELVGTPFARAYTMDNDEVKAEIRLNVSSTNILRPNRSYDQEDSNYHQEEDHYTDNEMTDEDDDFTFDDY